MSYDLLLRGVCDHKIYRETQPIEREILGHIDVTDMTLSDIVVLPRGEFNTVRLDRPLASRGDVIVHLNGEYLVPRDHPVYGWDLFPDELSIEPDKKTKIVFRKLRNAGGETKAIDPLVPSAFIPEVLPEDHDNLIDSTVGIDTGDWVDVTYTTSAFNCRKCHGLKELNDYQFGKTKRLVLVRDGNKLLQDITKAILTVIGSNPYHVWYGTSVVSSIGEKQSFLGVTRSLISKEIVDMLRKYQNIQTNQSQYQILTDEERLLELVNVEITVDEQDPTIWFIDITIRSASNEIQIVEQAIIVQGTVLYQNRPGAPPTVNLNAFYG